ncbi:bacteriophage holin [Methanoculleus sp.]|uniref:bacteriophage holin n=1 Tax=Methanoculleus sp. TaxID=90427 RepID=UPI0025F38B2D|nr:bacteriophage holin [Methanoculleus sp.]
MKLDLKAFALAGGLFWGIGIFSLTWWLLLTRDTHGRGSRYGKLIRRIYPGYRVSPKGSVIGLLWGFIDGLGAAAIFGLLYNTLAKEK